MYKCTLDRCRKMLWFDKKVYLNVHRIKPEQIEPILDKVRISWRSLASLQLHIIYILRDDIISVQKPQGANLSHLSPSVKNHSYFESDQKKNHLQTWKNTHHPLIINKDFMLDEMTKRNDTKFAIFWKTKNPTMYIILF